jgi:hypothetical protein
MLDKGRSPVTRGVANYSGTFRRSSAPVVRLYKANRRIDESVQHAPTDPAVCIDISYRRFDASHCARHQPKVA